MQKNLSDIIKDVKKYFNSGKGLKLITAAGIAGLCLILFSSWLPDNDNDTDSGHIISADDNTVSAIDADASALSDNSFIQSPSALESRLSDILAKIEGAGRCSVMITFSGSPTMVYAQDYEQESGSTVTELKHSHVVLDGKNGDSALIRSTENPRITGALIVSEGGESSVVREKLASAAAAVLGIQKSRIFVTS